MGDLMENERVVPIAGNGSSHEDLTITYKEWMVIRKLRKARELAAQGHRSRMEIMFYDGGKSCDITIEDRERVVERMVDKDMK